MSSINQSRQTVRRALRLLGVLLMVPYFLLWAFFKITFGADSPRYTKVPSVLNSQPGRLEARFAIIETFFGLTCLTACALWRMTGLISSFVHHYLYCFTISAFASAGVGVAFFATAKMCQIDDDFSKAMNPAPRLLRRHRFRMRSYGTLAGFASLFVLITTLGLVDRISMLGTIVLMLRAVIWSPICVFLLSIPAPESGPISPSYVHSRLMERLPGDEAVQVADAEAHYIQRLEVAGSTARAWLYAAINLGWNYHAAFREAVISKNRSHVLWDAVK